MPAATGTKRVRGIAISRKIVTGTEAVEFAPDEKPGDIDQQHTHKWKVYVKGVDNADISHFIRKVQFKLHDTYPNTLRTVESAPFELEETGWGEFEIQVKLHWVPEANEKMQAYWHPLKLHHYEGDIEARKARRDVVKNEQLDEVVFNEPYEQFYEVLTGGPEVKGKAAKGGKIGKQTARTAEIPLHDTPGNPFSQDTEAKEFDRLTEALKTIRLMKQEEQEALKELQQKVEQLKLTEGNPNVKKK